MNSFKKLNLIIGWIIFAIASMVYILTVEPTASWWDCGEYIATAYKLQVGHPPGAPLFQMIGRVFSLLAFGDTSKVALMINIMSALSSGLTIMFLFWTIVYMAKKIVVSRGEMTEGKMYAVFGSGIVGALAYTFTDSFWFSAVEGEVYAMSSAFTAVVFWAILRWESEADDKHSMRWIVLIAFIIGLSIGVHLLNLLAIPAIAFVYYFKKFKPSLKGIIITGILSVASLGLIMNGIIPWVVKLSSKFELFFVNSLGMPFNSGTIIYFILLIGLVVWGIRYTIKKNKVLANTLLLSFTFILIGYSSFFMIIIRANADPPINENKPEDAISLLSYLAREQYGDWPISYGQYYNATTVDATDGNPIYVKDVKKGKYIITDERKSVIPVYDPKFCTIFPRMWSSQKPGHIQMYKKWGKIKGIPVEVIQPDGTSEVKMKPTFGENLRFFFTYQVGHMYLRYFMWNFSGRQNDIESQGEVEHGNWLTGFDWFDSKILGLGPQNDLPDNMKSRAHNKFYMLPFLLGLIGLFFQLNTDKKDTLVVMLLFIMTGLAIVVYLNQYPYQPRERDYAYAGSFYAFAIWIGLGVLAIFDSLSKKMNEKGSAIAITLVALLLVPGIMAKEGWDDHNRSGKYATIDFASNYLNSCEPNAILVTNGDNDTFPLWYAQEVEGVRTDVRVVNFMLASGHWYVQQMMKKAYESEPLPFTLTYDEYENGINNIVAFYSTNIKGYVELKSVIDFIANDDDRTKLPLQSGEKINFSPTKKFKMTIDSAYIVNNKLVPEYMYNRIVPEIEWDVKQSYLYKNDLMILDIIATNNWKRPVYFANPSSLNKILNVDEYCHLTGFVYRFLPVKANNYISGGAGIDSEASYDILMNKCKWGNLADPKVYIDRESQRNSIMPKQNMMRVAQTLYREGENEKAIAVLDRALEAFPNSKFPFDMYILPFIDIYYGTGAIEKANAVAQQLYENCKQDIDYYSTLSPKLAKYYESDVNQAMGVLQKLSIDTKANKQMELFKEIDSTFREQLQFMQ
jgi:tetratricopeptide (TPR) repeat protein